MPTEAAVIAHRALGLRDISRAGLVTSAEEAFFLEATVTPGMTGTRTPPMAPCAAGATSAPCAAICPARLPRGEPEKNSVSGLLEGMVTRAKRGLRYVPNVHPAR